MFVGSSSSADGLLRKRHSQTLSNSPKTAISGSPASRASIAHHLEAKRSGGMLLTQLAAMPILKQLFSAYKSSVVTRKCKGACIRAAESVASAKAPPSPNGVVVALFRLCRTRMSDQSRRCSRRRLKSKTCVTTRPTVVVVCQLQELLRCLQSQENEL